MHGHALQSAKVWPSSRGLAEPACLSRPLSSPGPWAPGPLVLPCWLPVPLSSPAPWAPCAPVLAPSPCNPTGKVFTRDELSAIAALCQRHDLLAITDEVRMGGGTWLPFLAGPQNLDWSLPLACLAPGHSSLTVPALQTAAKLCVAGLKCMLPSYMWQG